MEFNYVARKLVVISLIMPTFLSGCLTESPVEPEELNRSTNIGTNGAPVIEGVPPPTVEVSAKYNFSPTASDPDSDPLIFSVRNQPVWATFNTLSGTLTGVPFPGSEGTYAGIVISVSDGQRSMSLEAFSVTVEPAPTGDSPPAINLPPEIVGTAPTTVTAGSNYSFTPSATDPDGDPLVFSIVNKPVWATFNTLSGALAGIPDPGREGTYDDIIISVTDGRLSTSLDAFSVTVNPAATGNLPPEITGTAPAKVTAGSNYSFVPAARDPNGDRLVFSIENKPGWATFNTTSGELSGTPQVGDVGSYDEITIAVTDGSLTASLRPFSVSVDQVSLGSVTLSWAPPTKNEDGSALTDLSSYRIYYGTSLGSYPNRITVENPGLTSYVVGNLAPGTYYFVSTAVNSAGIESTYSNVAEKTID